MILELKKYAFLAFLFVGFAQASAASRVLELTPREFAEKIAEEEAKAKELERTLVEQGAIVASMQPVIAYAKDIGQDATEAEALLAEVRKSLKQLEEEAVKQKEYVENLKAAARRAGQDLVAVAARAGVTSGQRDAALKDGSLSTAFLISPEGHSKCGFLSCQEKGTQLCSRCRQVFYCSQECQKAHWKTHKASCIKK